ncbi:hypothetical protein O181_096562 [Austropuccinia psidii MF-1]|uniref:Endonuclease/exonuclease/phosphatase domain-containing protein n=1 Tax=Austropuccinia psidii MF-1 TaxID=1389203 RepID=A0A9Q3J7I5_9BASI|nr:hypothetical protein [Austropuccinia psidii MF-1]
MIDSNLHHCLWNPPQYQHSHPESHQLLKMCRKKGFKLISSKHIPTFFGSTGLPTTIDLTWADYIAQHLNPTTSTRINNHPSDHQPIITNIFPLDHTPKQRSKHLSIPLRKLDHKKFITSLLDILEVDSPTPLDPDINTINQSTLTLTKEIREAFKAQVKWVNTNHNHMKLW